MEVVRARSFTSSEDLRISPLKVRGRGASAVAVECLCESEEGDGPEELKGHFVAKFFKVCSGRTEPPAHALHEFEMLQAAKDCPHVVQGFGLFHVPPRGFLRKLLSPETLLPHALDSKRRSLRSSLASLELSGEAAAAGGVSASRVCAMLMERCDYSLQDFDFFRYTESEAAFVCRAVLRALRHLHELNIVHRDVKPGNILIGDAGDKIVLGDLGLATFLEEDTAASKGCGTHGFLAPECLKEKPEFCKKSDLFAMGAVLYQLLFRTFAFVKENRAQTVLATCFGDLPLIPCGRPVGKSDEACHLIRWLLEPLSCDRPTAASALEHEWFNTVDTAVTLRHFVSERHLRNDDDLDTIPVDRQPCTKASKPAGFSQASPTGIKKSLAQRLRGLARRLGGVAAAATGGAWRGRGKGDGELVEFDDLAPRKP